MESLAISHVDLGFPASGPKAAKDVETLAHEIASSHLRISAYCAARTLPEDIEVVANIVQKTGVPLQVAVFIASSAVRQQVEGWDVSFILRKAEIAIRAAHSFGIDVMFVTEDTTRSSPDTLNELYRQAIRLGAKVLVLCDTCGYSTPGGTRALVQHVRNEIVKPLGLDIRLDWHGHSDRGLGLANAFAALEAGAECVHGCILGIGERAGNVSLDQIIVNLHLDGISPWAELDLTMLKKYCELYSASTRSGIPHNYPVFGSHAFSTASGIHASAVSKALRMGQKEIINGVYSGVPSDDFGIQQRVALGPVSGRSNVVCWLREHDLVISDPLVNYLLAQAKAADECLTEEDIWTHYLRFTNQKG